LNRNSYPDPKGNKGFHCGLFLIVLK